MSFSRRLSAVSLALALVVGQAGVCAGWMPTAEARMACCSDEASCPMHNSDSERDGSQRVVSQTEADSCCASSEREDSAPSPSNLAFSLSLAVVIRPVPVLIPEPEARVDVARASAPITPARVPKHLLLSVFLV